MPIADRALRLYEEFFRDRVRKGIVRLFDAISDIERGGLVIARLPTGYGKSISSVFLAAAVKEAGTEMGISRVIHVLPLRSIVQQLYEKAVSMVSSRRCFPLKPDEISYQASVYLDEGSKNALFLSTLVYTTLDSYVLNFSKVTPFKSRHASYEAARAAIYTALTIFDEVHLFTEVDEAKAYTSLVTIIRCLLRSGLPVILLTATLSDYLTKKLYNDISPETCVVVTFDRGGSRDSARSSEFKQYIFDDESWIGAEIETRFLKYNQLLDKINELVKENKRILIVRNKVPLAIETYYDIEQKLGLTRYRLALLHGRLSHGDRRKAIEAIIAGNGEKKSDRDVSVIITTQVVEAGVDIDADVVITDPAPLAQLVQRVGRVKRQGGRGEAYILYDDDQNFLDIVVENVYDKDLVKQSVSEVRRALESCGRVDWRIPDGRKQESYYYLLNNVYGSNYANKLGLIQEVEDALSGIDSVVTVQRDAAMRIHERLCGFVRDTMMVPVLVCEELKKVIDAEEGDVIKGVDASTILDSIVNLDLSTICRHWFEIFKRDPNLPCLVRCSSHHTTVFVKVKVPANRFLRHLAPSRRYVDAPLALCREFMKLERIVSIQARQSLGRKGFTYLGFVGLIAKEGAYREGMGWEFDEKAAK